MKIRTKIAATYIGLTVVAIILTSSLSSWLVRLYVDRRLEASLDSHLQATSVVLRDFDRPGMDDRTLDASLKALSNAMEVRITLVAPDGHVVHDTDVPYDSLFSVANHGTRPEILQAKASGTGHDRRESRTLSTEFLYAARRIDAPVLGLPEGGFLRVALKGSEVHTLDRQIQLLVWGVGLVSVLAVAAVSFVVSRRITRPVNEIVATAQAIKDGDVGRRIGVSSNDEIGALAIALNEMAGKLEKDIEQLRKLERVRSEFLGNVSHELRTPIFSLQGYIETLLDGAIDDPSVNHEFLEKAHTHASRLNALLTDLIEISRIESGEMKLSFRYFPVVEFLEQVADEMQPLARKKEIRLALEAEAGRDVTIFADRDRLKQVMINLIDNAVKYTEPGGSVLCRVSATDERCVIQVEDTGCGIPEEHVGRIFERFYRVDRDRSRDVGGTGLGLAIVKHIVEAHQGKIGVETTVGKGSTFSLALKR